MLSGCGPHSPGERTTHPCDWARRWEMLEAGEITRDEYLDWKDAYFPHILYSPVTGEEIDDPFTGRRLEGPEREGASRAVRTLNWLNE